MIHIKNLKKVYSTKNRNVAAINNINIDIPDKGMVFVVGKSGSGKSTLLNILSGFDKPTEGQIIIGNKNIIEFSNEEMDSYRASCLGFVFQDFHLIENLNVADNIKMALSIKNESDDELVSSILKDVGLEGYETRRIAELSGGECQRVAIARSLIKNPHIILADEPTGNLDSKTSIQILKILKKISKENLVIIVSHNLNDAYAYGDRIIELKDGNVISDKVKNKNYKNEFKIDNGCVTLPYKKEITDNEIEEFKAAIAKQEIKEIKQLDDGFSNVSFNEDIDQEEIEFKKSKLPKKEINALSIKFIKRQKLITTMTIVLTTLLITLFGIIQSFMMFDTKSVINSFSDDYSNEQVVLYKGAYDDYNKYLSQSYIVKTEDDHVQDIINSGYKGNVYKLYTYALPISQSYLALSYGDKSYANTNLSNFYLQETYGLLVTDKDYLIKKFGVNNQLDVLAGNINEENGLIITDYIADSILYYQPQLYSTYDDVIGNFTIYNANFTNIKAIINTNYKTKYKSLLDKYNSITSIDSKLTKKQLLNSIEFKNFITDVSYNLGVTYSFDENFLETAKNSDSKQIVRIGNASISYNGRTMSDTVKLVFHLDSLSDVTLKKNEIMISYAKYNEIFGTKYTIKNYETDFNPHKITITKYHDHKTLDMEQEFEIELTIVGLTNGSISNARCNEELFNYLEEYEVFSYALYLDEVNDLGSLYNTIESNFYYVNIESYNAIKYISNVIINFKTFFSLIMAFVVILSMIVVAFFANSILNKNRKNIGVMRALGMRNIDIIRIFALQIFYMSLAIVFLTFISYFIFVNIGNEILIDTFTNIYTSNIINELTLISPNIIAIITDLIITIIVSSLTIIIQMSILKKIDVINIIKPKE